MDGAATLQPAQVDDLLNDAAHGASLGWSTWFALLRHCGWAYEVRDACSWALSGEIASDRPQSSAAAPGERGALQGGRDLDRRDRVRDPHGWEAASTGWMRWICRARSWRVGRGAHSRSCSAPSSASIPLRGWTRASEPCSPRHARLLRRNWGRSRRRTRCSRPRTRACVEG